MERLTVCSKVLYEVDLLNKQKEIHELKKIINIPKIFIQNKELWELKKREMYKIIKTKIDECILEDFDEFSGEQSSYENNFLSTHDRYDKFTVENDYDNILFNGLSSLQRMNINHVLYNELNKITEYKYSGWCEQKAWDIVYNIECDVQGLIYSDKICDYRDYELVEFIYKNIIRRLGDNTRFPSILDDIPVFIKN